MVGANIGAENLEAIAERCLVEVTFTDSNPRIQPIFRRVSPKTMYTVEI